MSETLERTFKLEGYDHEFTSLFEKPDKNDVLRSYARDTDGVLHQVTRAAAQEYRDSQAPDQGSDEEAQDEPQVERTEDRSDTEVQKPTVEEKETDQETEAKQRESVGQKIGLLAVKATTLIGKGFRKLVNRDKSNSKDTLVAVQRGAKPTWVPDTDENGRVIKDEQGRIAAKNEDGSVEWRSLQPLTVVVPGSRTTSEPASPVVASEKTVITEHTEREDRKGVYILAGALGFAALAFVADKIGVQLYGENYDIFGNTVFDPGDADVDISDAKFAVDFIDQDTDGMVGTIEGGEYVEHSAEGGNPFDELLEYINHAELVVENTELEATVDAQGQVIENQSETINELRDQLATSQDWDPANNGIDNNTIGNLSPGQNPWAEGADYARSLGYNLDPNNQQDLMTLDAIKDRVLELNHFEDPTKLPVGTKVNLPTPEEMEHFYKKYH